MLHDPKTVIESDFDQETEEKIAPQFIAQLDLANCIYVQQLIAKKESKSQKKICSTDQLLQSWIEYVQVPVNMETRFENEKKLLLRQHCQRPNTHLK